MTDGGGNFGENSIGGRKITAGAKYLKTLKLSQRKPVGNQLVYTPLPGSPVIKPGKDAGAFDVRSSSAATSIQALGTNPAIPVQKTVSNQTNSLTDSKGVNSANQATTDKATTDKAITQTLLLMNPSEPITLQASGNFLNGSAGAQSWGDGVTLTGYNADGTAGVVKFGWQGLAVGGGRYKQQIDYDAKTQRSEQLAIDFNGSVSNASVELGKMSLTEWGGLPETGLWSAYSANGDLVGRGKLDPRMATSTGGDSYLFNIQSGQTFDRLVIEATAYDNGEGIGEFGNNSDFNLKNITYTRAGEPPIEPPVQPPVEPPVEPPVQPPVQPPVEPPVQPPVEPPVEPPVQPPVAPPTSGKRISLTASASALSNVQNGSPLIQMWGDSVQISALDFDNSPLKVVYDDKFQDNGFGVAGTNDRWDQIDFYQNRGSEKVKLGFDTLVDNVTLTVGQMDEGEGSQGINGKFTNLDETGKWTAYDAEGKFVADGLLGPELSLLGNRKEAPGSYGQYPIDIDTSTPFAELVIEATGFGHGVGQSKPNKRYGENNSDFNVVAVSFDPLPNTNGSF